MSTPPGFVPTPPAPPPPAPPAHPPGVLPTDTPSMQERINALNARLAAAEAAATAAAALQTQLAEAQRRATLAERRADSGAFPALAHPDVSAHVSSQYEAYAARVGGEAKGYADWLKTDAATNPLVSVYLAPPPVTPGAPPPTAPPPVNPNGSVLPNAAAPPLTAFGRDAVALMDIPTVRANMSGILEQATRDGEVRYTPPKPRT